MTVTTFKPNPKFGRQILVQLDPAVGRIALTVQAEARRRVGVRGGSPRQYPSGQRPVGVVKGDKLRPSIQVINLGAGMRRVGSNLPYALVHHNGGRPHLIRPRKPGGVLVFHSLRTGTLIFTKVVHHPGNKPNRFLLDGARLAGLRVVPRLTEAA